MNSRKLLARITDKWPAKVLSVAVALIISVFHRMSTLETRFFSTPLHVETGDVLVPASSYTRAIKLSIRGEANSIYPILENDIEAYIDTRRYLIEGSYQIPVQIRKKGSALGVEPLEISVEPLEVSLKLERKIERHILVRPVFRGAVAAGYELINQTLVPAGVAAEGPHSILGPIMEFKTEPIDLEGRFEDFSVIVNIVKDDPLVVLLGTGMIEFRGAIRRTGSTAPIRNEDR